MSDAAQVKTRKAVVAMISDATLSQNATIVGSYAEWDLDLTKTDNLELQPADKLRVDVVTHGSLQKVNLNTRGRMVNFLIVVDIMVRRKLGQDKQDDDTGRIAVEEIDSLILFLQEIHLLFTCTRLAETNLSIWDGEHGGSEILWAPNIDHLRTLRQFSGLIRIHFKASVQT